MPAFLKTKEDERLWEKAKARAKEEGQAENWAYVTGIWKRMKGKEANMGPSAERIASRIGYDETGRNPDPDIGWEHGQVEPFEQTIGEGSQVPPARDHGGEPVPEVKLPAVSIPGYGEMKKTPKQASVLPRIWIVHDPHGKASDSTLADIMFRTDPKHLADVIRGFGQNPPWERANVSFHDTEQSAIADARARLTALNGGNLPPELDNPRDITRWAAAGTEQEAIKAFDTWWRTKGHVEFPMRDKAMRQWKEKGIPGVPTYPMRVASGFSTIDPRVHGNIDRALREVSKLLEKAKEDISWLESSSYPPVAHDIDEIRDVIGAAAAALEKVYKLLPPVG